MLLDDLTALCHRLAPAGWSDLLKAHGLNLTAPKLRDELTRDLAIDRGLPGFEDFSLEGHRGITPGNPAQSLLYHALASPNVLQRPNGATITEFPTPADLDVVENFIFSLHRPNLADLRSQFPTLSVVVFAYEYRTGRNTCHHRYADLCFSRTGVARIGTSPPQYDGVRRGFSPRDDKDERAIRVLPARYAAFLAIREKGAAAGFCPMRFLRAEDDLSGIADENREFWVPLHKLFTGTECLADIKHLAITLGAHHVNEKLRRIHLELRKPRRGDQPRDTGWGPPDIDHPPFRFTEDIAAFATIPAFGTGVLTPIPHPLVEPAEYQGKPLYFTIPTGHSKAGPRSNGWLSSSLEIAAGPDLRPGLPGPRHAPEYVNARHRLIKGRQVNLNDAKNDLTTLLNDYTLPARHFIDWTGDGWIAPECPQLAGIPQRPAYSLVTAPDFFPNVEQRQLTEWSARLPASLKATIWQTKPDVLSDQRFPANLELTGASFDAADDTVTAIVPLKGPVGAQTRLTVDHTSRHAHLPDDSAGVFEPGWDVSFDVNNGINHLAAYGLGSPFPEDAKLCAALSTFWPGAAPDATRTFEPVLTPITVSPLTDEEIGQKGSLPWDGEPGPRLITPRLAEYASFDRVDYVENALAGRFSLALTSHVDEEEYENRILAMAKVYETLSGLPNQVVSAKRKREWLVFSFRTVTPGDAELRTAETAAGSLDGDVYRFEMIRNGPFTPLATNPRRTRIAVKEHTVLFVGINKRTVQRILRKTAGAAWTSTDFP